MTDIVRKKTIRYDEGSDEDEAGPAEAYTFPSGAPLPSAPIKPSSGGIHLSAKDMWLAAPIQKTGQRPLTGKQADKLRYKNLYDMYALNASVRLKSPSAFKTQSSCPTFNGKRFKAYARPIEAFDKILQEQWIVQQKDYTGRLQNYYCYPDEVVDGVDFSKGDSVDPNNVPVDLKLQKNASPKEVIEGVNVLLDLMAPNSGISDLDKKRAEMTNLIVAMQKSQKVEDKRKQALLLLCKFMAKKSPELQGYHSMERKLKEAKKIVLPWLNTVHTVAIANIGMMGKTVAERQTACDALGVKVGEFLGPDQLGSFSSGCVPASTFTAIEQDPSLLTMYNRNQVIKFLIKYAQEIVKLSEEFLPMDWRTSFSSITKEQKRASRV